MLLGPTFCDLLDLGRWEHVSCLRETEGSCRGFWVELTLHRLSWLLNLLFARDSKFWQRRHFILGGTSLSLSHTFRPITSQPSIEL